MKSQIVPANESESPRELQIHVQRSGNRNPVISYLASLSSKDSRRVQKTALDQIANGLSNGRIDDSLEFPWEVASMTAWNFPGSVSIMAQSRLLKPGWIVYMHLQRLIGICVRFAGF